MISRDTRVQLVLNLLEITGSPRVAFTSSQLTFTTARVDRSLAHRLRIEPIFEVNLDALEHPFFNVFDVGELAPNESHRSFYARPQSPQ